MNYFFSAFIETLCYQLKISKIVSDFNLTNLIYSI